MLMERKYFLNVFFPTTWKGIFRKKIRNLFNLEKFENLWKSNFREKTQSSVQKASFYNLEDEKYARGNQT